MKNNKIYKVIDLSGFGNSGKTALTNLFQEFSSSYWVSEPKFEFEILRIKNGLIDLETAICDKWSPSRTSTSMYLFRDLVKYIGKNPKKFDLIGRLFNSGLRLDRRFNGNFVDKSLEYYNCLIEMEYKAYNLYPFQNISKIMMPAIKSMELLNKRALMNETNILPIRNKQQFYEETKRYLNSLCSSLDIKNEAHTIILNNAIEPYDPIRGINLFFDAKQIAVDRDPRDLYLSSKIVDPFVGKYHMGFTASDNLDDFIYRYRYLREKSSRQVFLDNPRLLKINFEDLVLNYDKTKEQIFKFIEEKESIQITPKKYFDPSISIKGVGMWKNVDGQLKKDIDKIYSELKDYCLDI
jgi:effector-binding domain-containing protein